MDLDIEDTIGRKYNFSRVQSSGAVMLSPVFMMNIPPLWKTLYRILCLKGTQGKGITISVADLSAQLGSSRENIKEAIGGLCKEQLLEVVPQKHGPNLYKPVQKQEEHKDGL